jgi:hypothetical protein
MGNAASFRLELDKMGEAIQAQAVEAQRRVVLDLFTTLNLSNPVGNPTAWKPRQTKDGPRPQKAKGYVGGQSRRNWRLAFVPDRSIKGSWTNSPTGSFDASSLSEAEGFLRSMRQPTSLWLTNPMPYMDRLEAGHSKQVGAGWVRRAVTVIAAKYGLRAT